MSQCKCSMSIGVLGDGCRHCQPQEYIDQLSETLDDERADHLASHAYDEEVERAAFEAEYTQPSLIKRNKCGLYQCDAVRYSWIGWEACAKSRAKRFGGAE